MSNALFRGANVTAARIFFELRDWNGLETYSVPSLVLNPPLAVRIILDGWDAASLRRSTGDLCFVASSSGTL